MRNTQKAFLKEENLLTLFSQNNFIIPEIQREYVWGNNERVIIKFLKELKTKIGVGCSHCNLPEGNTKINIGFLYSYKPDYVKVQNDRFLDENLIDGQQRFTTLFLLTFYFALKENRKNDFLALIRFEGVNMGFDFKVRDLTKRFLLEFVEKTNTIDELKSIKFQTWFLKDYKTDLSIKAMLKSLFYIQEVFNCNTKYYNHLLSNIVFWHFKTEVTSEGEELYITMNARGEDLADNEITKAALMLDGKDLFHSGKKWEEWQHIFWKHRDKGRAVQSADFGFNAFINCISGLENYLRLNGDDFSILDIENLLTLEKVEKYIFAFNYLKDNSEEFKSKYSDVEWVDNCLSDIWEILNNNDTNWFVDYTDQNKSTEQNRMIFIWSWLLYLKDKSPDNTDLDETFRVLRFFYIRFKNNNRAVTTLKQTIGIIDINGVFGQESLNVDDNLKKDSYRTKNEKLKYFYLNSLKVDSSADLLQIEGLIWEIEDHPLNLEGADLGNINSSHLIDFEKKPNVDDIERVKLKLYNLFPIVDAKLYESNTKKLRCILFWYGTYWQKKWASYYWKYNFGEWRRIVRDLDSENSAFKTFFKEYLSVDSLDDFFEKKVIDFKLDNDTENDALVFKWYASKLKEQLWNQGQYIATSHYKHPENDRYFPIFKEFVNIKGNFNGGSPQVLSNLVKHVI